jgi:hypothetical protein
MRRAPLLCQVPPIQAALQGSGYAREACLPAAWWQGWRPQPLTQPLAERTGCLTAEGAECQGGA